ncbi:LemA family protein [Aurantimonas sp. Leaf443]|uniref:LemA family protein n=1 Tax=Aurantimonas sp. Leaf443 TaxID=1736378 RepID=UPI0006FDC6BC|nr:LemA family protein [Aurantimonas sp. Leaf443]KQT85661.1 LemA family protein [Aurantimonas sp. Leaf443]
MPAATSGARPVRFRSAPQRPFWTLLVAALLAPLLSACGINAVPTYQERAQAAFAEVQNQYQRRADLIPNLVETVKGYARQEQDVLTAVVEARARATQTTIDAGQLTDPAAVQRFQEAQDGLSGALSRLLVSVEAYPDLKSNANFLALQSQLEGTENRIAVARRDYIEAVRVYNTELRTIPGRWIAAIFYGDAEPMAPFTARAGAETPPAVDFGK